MNTLPSGDRRVDFSGWRRHQLQINGAIVVAHESGTGEPPVVYLHGGGTWHGIGFASGLSRHFRVILPHHPGFGQSQDNQQLDSVDAYVEHCRALFDTLGLTTINLVGNSLGGRIAAEFAARYPQRVNKLVLAAPAGYAVAEHPLPDLRSVAPEDFPTYLVHDMGVLLPYLPTGPDDEFAAMRAREGASAMRMIPHGLDNPEMPALLARISAPTLIIWGQEDRLIPAGRAEHWRRAIANAQLLVLSEVGHLPLDESADARAAMLTFLREPAS